MLGKILKYIRIYHHLSQKELAQYLYISRSYLSEIESNKKSATIELLEKYSTFFKVPVSSILLFSEQLESNTFPEKGRIFMASKVLKIMEWIAGKDNINDRDH